MDDTITAENSHLQTIKLTCDHHLAIENVASGNVLKIIGSDGNVTLSILITPAGPILKIAGAGLMIEIPGLFAVNARHIAIHGREGVAITSGASALISAEKDLDTQGRVQNIKAVLGNVNVKANDDVKLNGERILMNC